MAKEDNIGALWRRENKNGDEFFSGVLDNEDGTKTKIVVFKNGYKNKDTQPDYMVLRSKDKQDDFNFNEPTFDDDDLPF